MNESPFLPFLLLISLYSNMLLLTNLNQFWKVFDLVLLFWNLEVILLILDLFGDAFVLRVFFLLEFIFSYVASVLLLPLLPQNLNF